MSRSRFARMKPPVTVDVAQLTNNEHISPSQVKVFDMPPTRPSHSNISQKDSRERLETDYSASPTPFPNLQDLQAEGKSTNAQATSLALDITDDHILDHALNKLMKRQARKIEKKKISSELIKNDEPQQPPNAGARNLEMIDRITKLKLIKGITPKTKEFRFEEKMAMFKDLRTFIDVKQLMRGMSTPDVAYHPENRSASPASSLARIKPKEPEDLKDSREDEDKNRSEDSIHTTQRSRTTIRSDAQSPDILSIDHAGRSRVSSVTKKNNQDVENNQRVEEVVVESSKKKKRANKTVRETYKRFREQTIQHLGADTLAKIEKKASEPVNRHVAQKRQLDLIMMRKTQKDLKDFEIFQTLVDFLSEKEASVVEVMNEIRKDGDPNAFYKQLDKMLFTEGHRIDGDLPEEPPAPSCLDIIKEEHVEERYHEDNQGNTWEPYNNVVDEQMKMMNSLQTYKKRSDRIIAILRKKTKRLHESNFKVPTIPTTNIKAQLSRIVQGKDLPDDKTITLTNGASLSKSINDTNVTIGPLKGDPNKTKQESRFGPNKLKLEKLVTSPAVRMGLPERTMSKGAIQNPNPVFNLDIRKTSLGFLPSMSSANPITSAKRSIDVKKKKSDAYYTASDKVLKTWTVGAEEESEMDNEEYMNLISKKDNRPREFNNSVTKLYGDISNQLEQSKSLGRYLRGSIIQTNKFYDQKSKDMKLHEIPDALKMSKKPKSQGNLNEFMTNLTKILIKTNHS